MRPRELKRLVMQTLAQGELESTLKQLASFPAGKVLPGLFSGLCSCEPLLKWHAVSAMGAVVSSLANLNPEAARVVMRRFMWMLNDESGGIGWGVPEAMAEVCSCHPTMAEEYAHILVSFMREDGFYLELETLQQGLLWGVGRLAQARKQLLLEKNAPEYLLPYLTSKDSSVQGLAARAVGFLQMQEAGGRLENMVGDSHQVMVYQGRKLVAISVGELAQEALRHL